MSGTLSDSTSSLLTIVVFLIFSIAFYFIRKELHADSIKRELQPLFPDISSSFDTFYFKIHGLKAKLSFVPPSKYSTGSTTFRIAFPSNAPQKWISDPEIFAIIFESRGLFGSEYRRLSELKKRITIRTNNEFLKRNLAMQKDIMHALRDIYLTVDSAGIIFSMTKGEVTLDCSKYLRRGTDVKKIVVRTIAALECSLKAAAQSNVELSFNNPFAGHAEDEDPSRASDASDASDSFSSYTSSYMNNSGDSEFNSMDMDENDSPFYGQDTESQWEAKAGLSRSYLGGSDSDYSLSEGYDTRGYGNSSRHRLTGGSDSDYSLSEGYDTRGYGNSSRHRLTGGSDFSSESSDALALATPDRQRLAMNSGRNDRLNKAPGDNNYPPKEDIFEEDRIDEYSPKERERERDIETERADEESRLYF